MWKKLDIRNREKGFTLIEILIAVSLLAIVAAGVTAIIISITGITQKFTASSTTQNLAADTISSITRDISASTEIIQADDWSMTMRTAEDNQQYEIAIFYWNPADGTTAPDIVQSTQGFPETEAIIEYRRIAGSTAGKEIVLTKGYEKSRQDTVLFIYLDKDNKDLTTPLLGNSLDLIKRVEYRFSLIVDQRNTMIELASSAIPRSYSQVNSSGPSAAMCTVAPVNLNGTLSPRSTTSNLNWNAVSAATGYTVYRENNKQAASPMVMETFNSYTNTSFIDNTVKQGETYVYFVIANCSLGNSTSSNRLTLNATPDDPTIVNRNVTKSLTATLPTPTESGTSYASAASVGLRYTVARNTTNQVSWTPVNGAATYKIYRGATLIAQVSSSTRSYADPGRAFGDVTQYTVLATIGTINGSGGDGYQSSSVSLISPPAASNISAIADDSSTNSTYSMNKINVNSRAANTVGFKVGSHVNNSTPSCSSATNNTDMAFTGNSVYDTTSRQKIRWASSACYTVTGYNAAGDGATVTNLIAKQLPGKFSISSLRETSARAIYSSYYVMNESVDGVKGGQFNTAMTVNWRSSLGSNSYNVNKVWAYTTGPRVESATTQNWKTTSTSFPINGLTPGSYYKYIITAYAPNGTSRSSAEAVMATRPNIPWEAHSLMQGMNWDDHRRRATVYRNVPFGDVTAVDGKAWWQVHAEPAWYSVVKANAYLSVVSQGIRGGHASAGAVRSWWSPVGASREVRWTGYVQSGCNSTCGAPGWTDVDEQPDYVDGGHSYYRAR